MKIYSRLIRFSAKYPDIVVALGMFDGMHIGHQSIVRRAVELARMIHGTPMVFTFSNHPLEILAPESAPLLIGSSHLRRKILEELGVEVLLELAFTKKLSRLTPEEFMKLLQSDFAPRYVVTGPNYTFGRMGKGTGRMLIREGDSYGFKAEVCPAVQHNGRPISSTRIRALLAEGDLDGANEFLGRPFTYLSRVVHGDRRGRELGFPTANLVIPENRAMLPNGAYAVKVEVRGSSYFGLASIGRNPTFAGERQRRLEVNIRDFSKDIYNELLAVSFLGKLRDEQKFASADQLVRQLRKDRDQAERFWK